MTHHNLPHAMKIRDAKAALVVELEKFETIPGQQLEKEKRTVHFALPMNICHLKNSELEPPFQKYKKVESYSDVTL